MVCVQVVCRNTANVAGFAQRVKAALDSLGLPHEPEERVGHLLVELDDSGPAGRVLEACRREAYAYLRLTAWEKGGAFEATSDATCVAGLAGQPLRPIITRILGERANLEHALFQSRSGLVLANVRRRGSDTTVSVAAHRIRALRVEPPETIVDETFGCPPQEWLAGVQARTDLDRYLAVIRSALRKAECVFCAHCHFSMVDERGDEREDQRQSSG